MNWFTGFLTSSIGQKFVMSLTGLFLILYLVIHLAGNLQLLAHDEGRSFNLYAHFMTHNPLIKIVSYVLYASILLHAIQGWALWRKNRSARGVAYAIKATRATTTTPWVAKSMAALGTIVFVFIVIHMYQFWVQMHWGEMEMVQYAGAKQPVKDLYTLVDFTYENVYYVLFYVLSMAFIGFHLWHGFQSAFRTLGLSHHKYVPVIRFLGRAYSIVIPALFALIPIYMYFNW
jgi:succinate dehydrogenase / fumarate reductase cytochrome b subunit